MIHVDHNMTDPCGTIGSINRLGCSSITHKYSLGAIGR